MSELDWTYRIWKLIDSKYNDLVIGRERRLWDGTRVDLLTSKWAIEVDWAKKWSEAIGQSVWYALNTNKDPGVILLSDIIKDKSYIYRCRTVCTKLNIMLWLVDTNKSLIYNNNNEKFKI